MDDRKLLPELMIGNRRVDPVTIAMILPYQEPFDLHDKPFADLNSTLILTERPCRLDAARHVQLLAAQLGFYYLPRDNVAINPGFAITVVPIEPPVATWNITCHSKVVLESGGITRERLLQTKPDELDGILLQTCPRPDRLFLLLKSPNLKPA